MNRYVFPEQMDINTALYGSHRLKDLGSLSVSSAASYSAPASQELYSNSCYGENRGRLSQHDSFGAASDGMDRLHDLSPSYSGHKLSKNSSRVPQGPPQKGHVNMKRGYRQVIPPFFCIDHPLIPCPAYSVQQTGHQQNTHAPVPVHANGPCPQAAMYPAEYEPPKGQRRHPN